MGANLARLLLQARRAGSDRLGKAKAYLSGTCNDGALACRVWSPRWTLTNVRQAATAGKAPDWQSLCARPRNSLLKGASATSLRIKIRKPLSSAFWLKTSLQRVWDREKGRGKRNQKGARCVTNLHSPEAVFVVSAFGTSLTMSCNASALSCSLLTMWPSFSAQRRACTSGMLFTAVNASQSCLKAALIAGLC